MRELKIKDNDTGLKVYINDFPDIKNIPKDIFELFIKSLEDEISEQIKQKRQTSTKLVVG